MVFQYDFEFAGTGSVEYKGKVLVKGRLLFASGDTGLEDGGVVLALRALLSFLSFFGTRTLGRFRSMELVL